MRPTTIHDPSFRADALERTLARCQLRPTDVVFEISEQESIDNFAIFREVRDSYGKLGFQIALDDTGAGYASLESVMELAPEFIKVDRAFVTRIDEDPARQELLRALQSLAQRIGARIIGEGLDTLEELETLGPARHPVRPGLAVRQAAPAAQQSLARGPSLPASALAPLGWRRVYCAARKGVADDAHRWAGSRVALLVLVAGAGIYVVPAREHARGGARHRRRARDLRARRERRHPAHAATARSWSTR